MSLVKLTDASYNFSVKTTRAQMNSPLNFGAFYSRERNNTKGETVPWMYPGAHFFVLYWRKICGCKRKVEVGKSCNVLKHFTKNQRERHWIWKQNVVGIQCWVFCTSNFIIFLISSRFSQNISTTLESGAEFSHSK